jgi:hypothetical protein
VDELRLTVYPLIAGKGKLLFRLRSIAMGLEPKNVQQLDGDGLSLICGIA